MLEADYAMKKIMAGLEPVDVAGYRTLKQILSETTRTFMSRGVWITGINVSNVNMWFDLVNLIAYDRITRPKEIESLYQTLPQEKRDAIEERDKVATPST